MYVDLSLNSGKYGVDNMRDLFLRSFSSIHVLYVPLKGWSLGTDENVLQQYSRLLRRIRKDTEEVQRSREKAWMRFDVKQLNKVFHYAFEHLGSRSTEPFDFCDSRSRTDLPENTQNHVAEFLKCSLRDDVIGNFKYAAKVLASCLVIQALREEGESKTILITLSFVIILRAS